MNCTRPGDIGTLGAALLKTLTADYGVSFQMIDRGYSVLRHGAGAAASVATEGANDGCATYTEVLQTAVDLSTTESWNNGRQRLFHQLFAEHNLKLPWVVADAELSAAIIKQVNEIKGRVDSSPLKIINRIYREMLPLEAFSRFANDQYAPGAINPREGVWKLHAYARLAGLDPRFVLVHSDKDGVTTDHVAMRVHEMVVDPVYNMVDGQHQEVVEISPLQALSYHYIHMATDLKDVNGIMLLLDQALILDPSNSRAKVYKLLVSKGRDDPLLPMRDAMMARMAVAWR